MQKRLELLIAVTIKSIKDWVDFVSHKIYSEYNFIFFLLLFKLDMLGKISEFIPLNLVWRLNPNSKNLFLKVKTVASPFLAFDPNSVMSTSNAEAHFVERSGLNFKRGLRYGLKF